MKERAQILTILPVLLFGVIAAFGAFYFVASEQKSAALEEIAHTADIETAPLENQLLKISHLLDTVTDFFDRGQSLTVQEFSAAAVPDFDDYEGLGALAWVARVEGSERAEFEQGESGAGETGFQILEGSAGAYTPAATRSEYFPILFAAASHREDPVIGFNLGSEATRLALLNQAELTRSVYASPLIPSIDELGLEQAFLVALPVFEQGDGLAGGLEPQGQLRGFVIGGIVLDDLMSMLPPPQAGAKALEYYIFQDRPEGRSLIFGPGPEDQFDRISYQSVIAGDYIEISLDFAGQSWTVLALPPGGVINIFARWQPWLAAFISLLLALAIAWIVIGITANEYFVGVGAQKQGRPQNGFDEDLQESEEKLRQILNNVADGIISIRSNGEIDGGNAAIFEMFGYEEDELVGQNIGVLMPQPFRSNHDSYIKTYLETGEAKILGKTQELTCQKKDGSKLPVELVVSEIKEGNTHLFTGVMRDISDRKRVDNLKNEFISTVSHELRTPLTSIRGSLGIVVNGLAGQLPAKATTLLKIAHQSSERLVGLVNDILDLERIESGRMEYHFNEMDVNELIAKAIEANEAYADQYEVKFQIHPFPEPAYLNADFERLIQVMNNLLSNAAKFSPKGSTIDVWLERRKSFIRVTVQDYGDGIPENFRDRIFDRFAQADSSDTRAKGGTGLGLFIFKKIIERHGGTVGFDTETGRGTKFYFDLPEYNSAAEISQDSASTGAGQPVLVCEDDRTIAEFIRAILEDEGCEVDVAHTAREGFRKATNADYAAMTLALMLPDRDGISLIRALKNTPKGASLPIIVISSRAKEGHEKMGDGALGIKAWIQKPIKEAQLREAINQVIVREEKPEGRILHVENDKDLVNIMSATLEQYAVVDAAYSIKEAKEKLAQNSYNLILLDLNLPDGKGRLLVDHLKSIKDSTPIIVFTGSEVPLESRQDYLATFVKSRDSNERLISMVKAVLADPEAAMKNAAATAKEEMEYNEEIESVRERGRKDISDAASEATSPASDEPDQEGEPEPEKIMETAIKTAAIAQAKERGRGPQSLGEAMIGDAAASETPPAETPAQQAPAPAQTPPAAAPAQPAQIVATMRGKPISAKRIVIRRPAPQNTPPKNAAPEKADPKKTVSKKAVPKKAASKKAVPKKAVPKKAASKKAVPKKAAVKKTAVKKTKAKKAGPKKAK